MLPLVALVMVGKCCWLKKIAVDSETDRDSVQVERYEWMLFCLSEVEGVLLWWPTIAE